MTSRRIVTLFLLFGVVWILASDWAITLLTHDAELLSRLQSLKGLVFVGLSACLVYVLVRYAERTRARLEAQTERERDRLARILDVTPAVIYHLRPSGNQPGGWEADFISHMIEPLTGYPPARWMADAGLWARHIHPDDQAAVQQAQQQLASVGSMHHEYRIRHADGSYRWIDDHVVLQRDESGQPIGMIGAWTDMTPRRDAQVHARLIAHVFEASQEGIFITDAQARFLTANPAFTRITGYALDEVRGRTPALLKSDRQDAAFYAQMWSQMLDEGHWEGEIWNRRKSGEIFPEWLVVSAIRNELGQVQQFLGIFTDTSKRKAAEARILHLANYDSLTDLPNRALLADRAGVALSLAAQQRTPVAVMHLNVDRFSLINESLGHEAGDQVLRELARRLTRVMQPEDTLCRLGADDFILLLPVTPIQEVAPLSLRLMDAVAAPLQIADQTLRLSVSIGVATYPDNGTDLDELTRAAESAVHHAKRDGRNTVRLCSRELQIQVEESMALASELRWALDRRQLLLHYQPQVDAQGRVIGIEALLRWQHPQWGMVPPGRFIPIAEEYGLIKEIGTWVLHEALRQTAAWLGAGLAAVPVAVNLSVVQFRDPQLREAIRQALERSGVDPGLLELELTESVAMENSDFTVATIAGLKQLGVKLSIDDFGTGYSSLSYLKRFTVDKLKIDQSFVRGIDRDPLDESIVLTVIGLARNLGLHTIAEGVETPEQADFLRRNGCDEMQGYLFGRPMPPEAMAAMLGASRAPA